MKTIFLNNKIINFSLVNLVIFTSFSCNNIEKVKEKEPIKEVIKEIIKPSPSILITPTSTSNPKTSSSILETVNPVISEIPKNYNTPVLIEESGGYYYFNNENQDYYRYKKGTYIGQVLDFFTKKPLSGIEITSKFVDIFNIFKTNYYLEKKTISDSKGEFRVDLSEFPMFEVYTSSEGYSKRVILTNYDPNSYYYEVIQKGRKNIYFYISKNSEIINIKINNNNKLNRVNPNDYKIFKGTESEDNSNSNAIFLLEKDVTDSRLDIENTKDLKIELEFNSKINKESFEKALIIENIDNNNEIYDFKNIKYEWLNENKKVVIYINLPDYKKDKKLKLSFISRFKDIENNETLKNSSIAISGRAISELSDYFIFTILGKKDV
ncbi:MAG: hypothetical protein U0457_17260 [Candidatus Sericytochromatia bacterium]